MQKLVNRILVPVDFSGRSKSVAEKAMEFAVQHKCIVHLLHVDGIGPLKGLMLTQGHLLSPLPQPDNYKELEYKIRNTYLSDQSEDNPGTHITIRTGNWTDEIMEFVQAQKIDLVFIGQKSKFIGKRKLKFNPDKIASKTNIPVITVPANRKIIPMRSIVIPVTDFLPIRKIIYGIYFASGASCTIKLLGVSRAEEKEKALHYLVKASQLIKEHCVAKVQIENIISDNVASAIERYARAESADLVILNPGKQSAMPGFFSSFFKNIIQKYAAPPVLTLNPVENI
jgi:nucleotide-binding universal stress UspA family protein